MNHLYSINELFDFLKRKDSEDDKIAIEFIKRLEKVKDENPYPIRHEITMENPLFENYKVSFDDTPISIFKVYGKYGFYKDNRELMLSKKFKKYTPDTYYGIRIYCEGEKEILDCNVQYMKKLYELSKKLYTLSENKKRLDKINININPAADLLESKFVERTTIFKNKRNQRLVISVTKTPDGRITNIENKTGIRFPFSVGQILNRNAEVWACNNNFLMDDKDTCPEKKIFGVRSKDVPQGHEWRHIFPNKF